MSKAEDINLYLKYGLVNPKLRLKDNGFSPELLEGLFDQAKGEFKEMSEKGRID